MTIDASNITIVILAGGRGTRVGGIDKGLMLWRGKPLIEHILAGLPENSPRLINANRNIEHYRQYGLPVIADTLENYQGPLAGILSAMKQCKTGYLLCLPCDSPKPPAELAERLWRCMSDNHKTCAVCHDGERMQPLFALLSLTMQPQLETWLTTGQRKVEHFFLEMDAAVCDFSDQPQCFHNFNTPEDMT